MIEASTYYRVSIAKYAAWELDKHSDTPKVFTGAFSLAEICFAMRVRARRSFEEMTLALNGMPQQMLDDMEYGKIPCAALVDYWLENGL